VSATSANHYSIAPGAQRFSRSSPGPGRPRGHDLPVVLAGARGAVVETTLGELLPRAFSKRHLA
jgi:hypothetical protein